MWQLFSQRRKKNQLQRENNPHQYEEQLSEKSSMIYLDSNVFLYAAVNTQEPGEKARSLLQKIQQGDERQKPQH